MCGRARARGEGARGDFLMPENSLALDCVWIEIQKFMLRCRERALKSAPTDITFPGWGGGSGEGGEGL